jgi:uncharacterized protein YbaR (Trm112 family)
MNQESPEDRMDEPSDIDPKLLEILVCPLTKGPLRYDRAAQELISEEAGLAYPIRDGIPIMLVDEARALRDDEIAVKRLPPVGER